MADEKEGKGLNFLKKDGEAPEQTKAAEPEELKDENLPPVVRYSSAPIQNYRIGRYVFQNGLLELSESDAEAFDKLIATLPVREQATIKKVDLDAANKIGEQFLATQRTRGVDTSDSGAERRV